jgi:hypothetical protein
MTGLKVDSVRRSLPNLRLVIKRKARRLRWLADMAGKSGGDEIRTRVQTYSSKAFYMLILFWGFREQTGNKQPTCSLAA